MSTQPTSPAPVNPSPKYTAYCAGICLEAGDDLDGLIAVMAKDSRGSGEDVVVWAGSVVAAIIYSDSSIQRMESNGPGWMRLPPDGEN